MTNNEPLDNILEAAEYVINTPSTTLGEACAICDVNLSTTSDPVLGMIIAPNPTLTGLMWVYDKIKRMRRASHEKERMKNEIIRKQQAIINKLQKQNELNQQEIKNLKDTLELLEKVISQIEAA